MIVVRVPGRVRNHEMGLERQFGQFPQPLDDHRAVTEIRNEMPVHDVEVQHRGTGRFQQLDLPMKIAEVAFEHRRGNQRDRVRESFENRLSARQNGSCPRSASIHDRQARFTPKPQP